MAESPTEPPPAAAPGARSQTHLLNRLLPAWLRDGLRALALRAIPSMRHLDMPRRMRHLRALGLSPRVIYDVGAAHGHWAREALKVWPAARVIGFEPRRFEHPRLDQMKARHPGFDYLPCFLGAQRSTVHYRNEGRQTSLYAEAGPGGPEEAPMEVLDELIASGRLPPPDFIKLDVQGFELEVLKGGAAALGACRAVLAEVNFFRGHPQMPLAGEVIDFLAARGFAWYDVWGLLRRPADDALFNLDLLFLRADDHLRRHAGWTLPQGPTPGCH